MTKLVNDNQNGGILSRTDFYYIAVKYTCTALDLERKPLEGKIVFVFFLCSQFFFLQFSLLLGLLLQLQRQTPFSILLPFALLFKSPIYTANLTQCTWRSLVLYMLQRSTVDVSFPFESGCRGNGYVHCIGEGYRTKGNNVEATR